MVRIDHEKDMLKELFDMLQAHMGNSVELVLHNLNLEEGEYEHSIVDIRNGYITNRKIGDSGDEEGLQAIRGVINTEDTFNEFLHTEDQRILRCSSIYIRDDKNRAIGSICINSDITKAIEAEQFLHSLNICRGENIGTADVDISTALDDYIQEAFAIEGKTVEEMKREDKIHFVRYLDSKGVFSITKAGTRVCNLLGISKYTLYNYLGRNNGGQKNEIDS